MAGNSNASTTNTRRMRSHLRQFGPWTEGKLLVSLLPSCPSFPQFDWPTLFLIPVVPVLFGDVYFFFEPHVRVKAAKGRGCVALCCGDRMSWTLKLQLHATIGQGIFTKQPEVCNKQSIFASTCFDHGCCRVPHANGRGILGLSLIILSARSGMEVPKSCMVS